MTTIRPVGIPSAEAFGIPTIVQAVAQAVYPPGVTRADLEAVVGVLVDAIRDTASAERIARQVEAEAPMFVQLGRFLRTPGGVVAILGVLLAVLALIPPVVEMATPDDPPTVTGPSSAEVEQIVSDRLRELTESDEGLPGLAPAPGEEDASRG